MAGPDTTKPTGYLYDPIFLRHLAGGTGHPECPARLLAIQDELQRAGLASLLAAIEAREISDEQLQLAHDSAYIDLLRRELAHVTGLHELSTGDTLVSSDSMAAARCAAGGVLAAVQAVARGELRNAFCAVRPPGHHATRSRGMGFCLFNNAALAARYVQRACGLGRVLIVDWDYHHGNGTQDIFYEDPSVFYFSTHHYGVYPGTGSPQEIGAGAGRGSTLNVPLPPDATDEQFLDALESKMVPAARSFQPEFVIISAGFDTMRRDLLGCFDVTPEGFAAMTRLVMQLADELCGGKIVSVLEGGYRLDGLAESVAAHVAALQTP